MLKTKRWFFWSYSRNWSFCRCWFCWYLEFKWNRWRIIRPFKNWACYKITHFSTFWSSKMQTEVVLSTTEVEHIALSQSTRDLMPIRNIVQFLNQFVKIDNNEINAYSSVFEENSGVLKLATESKHRPRAKYVCVKHHHFRQHVDNVIMSIRAICTNDQESGIFTKLLALDKFRKFRKALMGW